ncbi:site-specific DNA-methyltransferase [Syntrophomonas wolfei]|jgi:adenine-specific DNA-methyltransferase|uniref:site-specific DNA-methyltransferase n=1 Tax=Syntrophomonas wolfei TaxID=863 RepID=UPI000774D199|nr:site-specific DNA-methyltransferase [Syntrophomonas wolfei]
MNKFDGKTMDLVQQNIDELKKLFPEALTEGKIDFDQLRLLLGDEVDTGKEKYEFTWPGKSDCIRLSQQQSTGTLRPDKESSKDWGTTQNLYIEGDNLEVLRLLQKAYHRKVKMIYIDPPYNTGNDFIYEDDFRDNVKNYKEKTEQDMMAKPANSGRYHSDWLNMMHPRLNLAKNLLRDEGVIFISIDDNEVDNLKKICNEIFYEYNFVEQLIWKRRSTPPNDRVIGKNHEYILVYAKDIEKMELYLQPRSEGINSRYSNPDTDPRGDWVASDLSANGKGGRLTESCIYPIKNPITREEYYPPQNKCWLYNEEKMTGLINEGRIGFRANSGAPFLKRYLSEVRQGATLPTIIDNGGFSSDSAKEIKDIFSKDVFEFPKTTKLLKILVQTGSVNNDIILDFFSGSATTAHSVMQLNAEDNGNRKFIMVQLPEPCSEDSEAYKAGFSNICEIGKERIRRAGEKIKEENKDKEGIENLDIGFKVFKLDTSNLKAWDPDVEELEETLKGMVDPIKEGRTQEDMLYEIMLKYGIDPTMPLKEIQIKGKTAYSVGLGYMIVCLEDGLTLDVIEAIGDMKQSGQEIARVVFRDSGFADDNVKTNAVQLLKKFGVEDFRTI